MVEPPVGAGNLATLARKETPRVLAVGFGKIFAASGSTVAAAKAFAGSLSSAKRSAATAVDTTYVAVALEAVVPFAAVVGLAVSDREGESAALVATVGGVVPFAAVILLARSRGQVAVRALTDAAGVAFGLAELVVHALLSGVDTLAGHDAKIFDGVPHAASFEVAVEGIGVLDFALEFASGVGVSELVAALIIGLTFGPRSVVEFALLVASIGVSVPLAASVGIGCAGRLGTVETASRVAVGSTLSGLSGARTLPVAESGFSSALSITVASSALLVALGAGPFAIVVSKAVALGES